MRRHEIARSGASRRQLRHRHRAQAGVAHGSRIAGSAAAVWLRSPSPEPSASCSSSTAPGASARFERLDDRLDAGQRGVEDAGRPAADPVAEPRAVGVTNGLRKPCGVRNRRAGRRPIRAGRRPSAGAGARSPARRERQDASGRSRGGDLVALARRCARRPPGSARRACRARRTWPLRRRSRSASRTGGVVSGDGPSSKVMATTGWAAVAAGDHAPEQRRVGVNAPHGADERTVRSASRAATPASPCRRATSVTVPPDSAARRRPAAT